MSSLAHARTLAAYDRWMNERLYALCAELSDEEPGLASAPRACGAC